MCDVLFSYHGKTNRDCDLSLLSFWITIICKWDIFQVANLPWHNGALNPLISTDIPPQVSIFVFMQCLINALKWGFWNKHMEFISLNVRQQTGSLFIFPHIDYKDSTLSSVPNLHKVRVLFYRHFKSHWCTDSYHLVPLRWVALLSYCQVASDEESRVMIKTQLKLSHRQTTEDHRIT